MRKLFPAMMAVVLGTGAVLGGAAPASAAVADITCLGSQTVHYSPGLTLVPTDQTISVTTDYATCVSTTEPDITSGQSFITTEVPARTCLSPLDTDTITVTITWNTGATSTFTATRTVTDLAATILVTYTGTIVSGTFAGALLAQVIEYPNIVSVTCLFTPLTSRTGATIAEITSV